MMKNVKITSIGTYHPERVLNNEEFIKYAYPNWGEDVDSGDFLNYMEHVGRNRRHVADSETVIELGLHAAINAISKAKIKTGEIDAIFFVTDNPEYTTPINSLFIHKMLGCRHDVIVNDFNANCVGMINAISIISDMIECNNNINKVLVVAAQKWLHYATAPALKCLFGDSGCAVILERDHLSGIDAISTYTNSELVERFMFPSVGMSNLKSKPLLEQVKHSDINVFAHAPEQIKKLLNSRGLKPSDISLYCMSQYTEGAVKSIANGLVEPISKFPYVGDEYGYTGVTSPILVFNYAIENNLVHRGDSVVLWSVGTGMTSSALLLQY